jgi:adenosyl cobinamide kinase/adenosyl cobinamide phosphate guanylyltransferase
MIYITGGINRGKDKYKEKIIDEVYMISKLIY